MPDFKKTNIYFDSIIVQYTFWLKAFNMNEQNEV